PGAGHHAPRLPTYPTSSTRFELNSRCMLTLHWFCRAGRPEFGSSHPRPPGRFVATLPGCDGSRPGLKLGHVGIVFVGMPFAKIIAGAPGLGELTVFVAKIPA